MITVMTWFWRQRRGRVNYQPEHVNIWAAMVRRHCSMDIDVACITDHPQGIDDTIRIIKPPRDFEGIQTHYWHPDHGKPQCYRRIAMYDPKASDWIGSDRFVCMDLDVIIMDSLDPLWDRPDPIVLFRGSSGKRPYNGSMVLMTCGAAGRVYTEFSQRNAERASRIYLGSDQAWISHCLGKGKPTWSKPDGVYAWGSAVEAMMRKDGRPPSDCRMLFTPGPKKPWHLCGYKSISEHYHV